MFLPPLRLVITALSPLLLLTACAPAMLMNAGIEQDRFAKRFTAPDDKSLIYVYIDEPAPNISKHLVVDGRVAGLVGPSSYLMSNVAPGQHRIGLGHTAEDIIVLDTEQGKTYFITANVSCVDGRSRAQLRLVDESTGRQHVLASSLANITLLGRPLLNDKPANDCRLPGGSA